MRVALGLQEPQDGHVPSPELAPPFPFLLFSSPLCFPLTKQKRFVFAGVLIPAKVRGVFPLEVSWDEHFF